MFEFLTNATWYHLLVSNVLFAGKFAVYVAPVDLILILPKLYSNCIPILVVGCPAQYMDDPYVYKEPILVLFAVK